MKNDKLPIIKGMLRSVLHIVDRKVFSFTRITSRISLLLLWTFRFFYCE